MTDEPGGHQALTPGQLARLNRLATSARMVAGLAHELNNSLQVVSALVELLGGHPAIPPDVALRVERIGLQADKATSVIRQVLVYTREGAAEQRGADLAAVVERALGLRRYNLGRAGITVHAEVPGGIPVPGDERALLQIVLNLVLNAEDALAGQPARDLRITATRSGDRVQLAVADSGHGIAADVRGRIFEAFFTTRTDPRAIGLGLPTARVLAQGLGGEVTLAGAAPGATTFAVDLPVRV